MGPGIDRFQQPILCIMGPTASGKSALAMKLARHIDCELISVDSAMVYRGMDVGTAKPTLAERNEVVHHLLDIRDPAESYSAGQFCTDASAIIATTIEKGKLPILVGGTMLYFHALQHGLADLPTADPEVRQRLLDEAASLGWPALHQRLMQVDPVSGARIKPTDTQRIQRALEVYEVSGKSLTELWQINKGAISPYSYLNVALMPASRSLLHDLIAERFRQMLKQGLVEEVQQLFLRNDLCKELPSIRCVGYRQVWEYLAGEINWENMSLKAIAATRQLAKRQITWLRSWQDLHLYESNDTNLPAKLLRLLQKKMS